MSHPNNVVYGDCIEVMRILPDCSVDSVVCDPPYDLTSGKKGGTGEAFLNLNSPAGRARISTGGGFMGQAWDATGVAFDPATWRECLRVLKPGGHLIAFGGTRTYHRMVCAIEDAGFEIRDSLKHFYGGVNVCKGVDIPGEWKSWSETARSAGLRFARSPTEAGLSTSESGSAPEPVLLATSHVKSPAGAIIAELKLSEARLTDVEPWRSALSPADVPTTESSALVSIAGSLHESLAPMSSLTSTAQPDALGWLSASREAITRAVEALRILRGAGPYSKQAATSALCAALTDALKHITCASSRTFQSYDTTYRTVSVSVTSVTITESTAESLLSFMGAILAETEGGDAREASGNGLAWLYGSGFP